ncbi:hypothetical protein [Kitasatospora sp. LaBMicrA B282]|uniref:hypothetical protein n=1 Tax=Kitasatospora sp. LaBMicrA B282 TaxID=3420949 RepID=UPI003D0C4181
MDIVYASLTRRRASQDPPPGEISEIVGALWAHATSADGLQYASGRSRTDRVDLLLYLLTPAVPVPGTEHRVSALLGRCHRASRKLQQDYLPPPHP